MNEIIKLIEEGNFTQMGYTIALPSGAHIWTGHGTLMLGFRPSSGKDFTWGEKLRMARAIKKGRIIQALRTRV